MFCLSAVFWKALEVGTNTKGKLDQAQLQEVKERRGIDWFQEEKRSLSQPN